MSDILREVDDLMRQERLMTLWRRHGNTLIAGIIAVILAVAVSQAYQAWTRAAAEKNTGKLLAVLDDPTALTDLGQAKDGNAAVLARILAAQKWMAEGKRDLGIPLLLAARNDARANKDLRDLATLIWVRVVADDPAIKPADLRAALQPLMRDDGAPFAFAARLEAAVIAAERTQDFTAAQELLAPMLNNQALPFTQSERARALSQAYQLRLDQQKKK